MDRLSEPELVITSAGHIGGGPHRRRRWWMVPLAVIVIGVLYYAVTLVQVIATGRDHAAEQADVIVVLGAAQYDGRPSRQFATRLDHAADLWRDGVAPRVAVIGGKLEGDRFTEAEAGLGYLQDREVPADAIVMVGEGNSTYESLAALADVLIAEDATDVVVVTDPYHSLRTRLTAAEVGLRADVASTPTSVVRGWTAFRRDAAEAFAVATGRVIGFGRLSGLLD